MPRNNQPLLIGTVHGKVRAMSDAASFALDAAGPSTPVQIMAGGRCKLEPGLTPA